MSDDVSIDVTANPKLERALADLAELNEHEEMERAHVQVATLALAHQREHFRDSAAGRGDWPELGAVTVVLRPGGPKLFEEADIETKRKGLKIMQQTNRLYQALTPAAPGNVMEALPDWVRVGVSLAYAARLHAGGESAFQFGKAERARFAKNVSPTKRGSRRPAPRKGGKRHSWKKRGKVSPWNEFYFKLRGALRKMSGRSYHVPARPIVRTPKPEWVKQYAAIIHGAVKRIISK